MRKISNIFHDYDPKSEKHVSEKLPIQTLCCIGRIGAYTEEFLTFQDKTASGEHWLRVVPSPVRKFLNNSVSLHAIWC